MNKIKFIFSIILLLALNSCDDLNITTNQSDEFVKFYGGNLDDFGVGVIQFNDGYVIAATITTELRGRDIALIETDKYGNQKNIKELGDIGDDEVSKIISTKDGGFIILGTIEDTDINKTDIYVAKFSSEMLLVWEKNIGNDYHDEGVSIAISMDGGYVVLGNTEENSLAGIKDILLVKLDNNGDVEWTKTYGGSEEDYASDILAMYNGYIISGTSASFNEPGQAGLNIITIEIDEVGGINHRYTYGGTYNDEGFAILNGLNGNYILLGSVEVIPGNSSLYAAELGSEIDNVVWNNTYNINSPSNAEIISNGSGYIIASSSTSGGSGYGELLKIDNYGNEIYKERFGGFGIQNFNSLVQVNNSCVIVGSSGYEGNSQICLVKVSLEDDM